MAIKNSLHAACLSACLHSACVSVEQLRPLDLQDSQQAANKAQSSQLTPGQAATAGSKFRCRQGSSK
jgi:hypothetical protein